MVLWNLGSCADQLIGIVDNVPDSISGANLLALIDRQRLFMEQYTGLTVGSVDIAEKFQPALMNLSIGETVGLMNLQGGDFNSIRLGELTVGKGAGGNLNVVSDDFKARGMTQLKEIGRKLKYHRTF
jgi:hypothetical protein